MKERPKLFDFSSIARISSPVWPGLKEDAVQPGDLSRFVPHGNGFYGLQEPQRHGRHPILSAPEQDAEGGVVWFGNGVAKEDLRALFRIWDLYYPHVERAENEYAAFIAEAEEPGRDKFLTQLRVVPNFALQYHFKVTDAASGPQPIDAFDLSWRFMQEERKRWGTIFNGSPALEGLCGGDGEDEREQLSFGLMLENAYYRVFRIWSRAWLVTK